MNHPMRLDGWRLYQSRFDPGAGGRESTILQVNRDPGLTPTYAACILLTIGLVIVFFQKPFLRRVEKRLKRDKAPPVRRLAIGIGLVLLAITFTVPGILFISFAGEGAFLLLGVVLIVVGLVAETLFLNQWIARKIDRLPPVEAAT